MKNDNDENYHYCDNYDNYDGFDTMIIIIIVMTMIIMITIIIVIIMIIMIIIIITRSEILTITMITIITIFRDHPFVKAGGVNPLLISIFGGLIMSSVSYWVIGQAEMLNCIGAIVMSRIGYVIMLG